MRRVYYRMKMIASIAIFYMIVPNGSITNMTELVLELVFQMILFIGIYILFIMD